MNHLPGPRLLETRPGRRLVSRRLALSGNIPAALRSAIERRLNAALTNAQPSRSLKASNLCSTVRAVRLPKLPEHPDAYALDIEPGGLTLQFSSDAGLHAGIATLVQLLREHGRSLPCLRIRDWPDFTRRGMMLDVSRGRVPKLSTLFELVEHLADLKINELQLYTEHTFAYRRFRPVWRDWGALTGAEIRKLDAHCRRFGIDLVPNQNSFGHLREFLAWPPLKPLAEVSEPYESDDGSFLRYPSTLAPTHPGSIPFLRQLYDELLPNFSSRFFNVGCDETWDLGRGQSRERCAKLGKGRVYLDFLKKVHREVRARGRRMMFWGDIILNHPELIRRLPRDVIALNWGYEADHPFEKEASLFARAKVPFYVCPGTSTWMTFVGRHDNALANLRNAAEAGRRHGAIGYLITDWGDGGHPQPPAVSYFACAAGAACAWCVETFHEPMLIPVLSRDVFADATQQLATAACQLGYAHRKLRFTTPNLTPLGAVLAAPKPGTRELFARDGLTYYRHIPAANIRAALRELERQLSVIRKAQRAHPSILSTELELAARMAIESCHYMLWQHAVEQHRPAARQMARRGIRELRKLQRDFARYWPRRNKASPARSVPFLQWRIDEYRAGLSGNGNALAASNRAGNAHRSR